MVRNGHAHFLHSTIFNLHLTMCEAPGGLEPPHKGFADLSLTTWVRRHSILLTRYVASNISTKNALPPINGGGGAAKTTREKTLPTLKRVFRAGNGIRTRDIHLGKVTLYQLSYSRKK